MARIIAKEGPDLPPLSPDLRHTPAEAIHNLFGAVFMQALQEQDREWVESPDYLLIADLAGIDLDLAERVRRMFLAGEIRPGAFAGLAPAMPPDRIRSAAQPSTTIRPVEMVRAIAATMPDAKPSEVIRACVAAGVNPATAATQVRRYRKALAESNN
ncbi:TPA: hypothetical protein ACRNI9_000390 [Pseudomonas aeruginosa]|nr:hypothetical protein [Pseudomonas aeruginosa]HBN9374827.1 hypothetical protein [Pseudomonas aeruginosa]